MADSAAALFEFFQIGLAISNGFGVFPDNFIGH
jgi:hypothetical protein